MHISPCLCKNNKTNVYFRLTEENYNFPSYKVFSNWKDASKTILPKIKITKCRKNGNSVLTSKEYRTMLENSSNLSSPLFIMAPISWFPKFLKQTINCHHWLLYAVAFSAGAATGAGAAPPVVGLTKRKKLIGIS